MGKLNKRERLLIGMALLIAAAGMVWIYALKPAFAARASVNEEIDMKRKRLSKSLRLIEKRPKLEKGIEDLSRRLQGNYNLLFMAEDIKSAETLFTRAVTETLKANGVSPESYDPLPPVKKDSFVIFSVSMDIRSTLEKTIQLLEDLQNSEKLFQVDPLEIRTSDNGRAVVVNMTVATFARVNEAIGPGEPAAAPRPPSGNDASEETLEAEPAGNDAAPMRAAPEDGETDG